MSKISDVINEENADGRKVLSIFLTAGFPELSGFTDIAVNVLENGADMLEIGIPFSDPLADGPTIQMSSQAALKNGITFSKIFEYVEEIKKRSDKPIILMGYANPILRYDLVKFIDDSKNSGVDGVIIPDVPLEEFDEFFSGSISGIDKILLTTPTSSSERIKEIDKKSDGFVYCVSVTGTTGGNKKFDDDSLNNLERTYQLISQNKMLIGFGISSPEDVIKVKPFCDGVIIGSALIKVISNNRDSLIKSVGSYIRDIKSACI